MSRASDKRRKQNIETGQGKGRSGQRQRRKGRPPTCEGWRGTGPPTEKAKTEKTEQRSKGPEHLREEVLNERRRSMNNRQRSCPATRKFRHKEQEKSGKTRDSTANLGRQATYHLQTDRAGNRTKQEPTLCLLPVSRAVSSASYKHAAVSVCEFVCLCLLLLLYLYLFAMAMLKGGLKGYQTCLLACLLVASVARRPATPRQKRGEEEGAKTSCGHLGRYDVLWAAPSLV